MVEVTVSRRSDVIALRRWRAWQRRRGTRRQTTPWRRRCRAIGCVP